MLVSYSDLLRLATVDMFENASFALMLGYQLNITTTDDILPKLARRWQQCTYEAFCCTPMESAVMASACLGKSFEK